MTAAFLPASNKFAVSGFSSLTGEVDRGNVGPFSLKGDVSPSTEGETPPGEEILVVSHGVV